MSHKRKMVGGCSLAMLGIRQNVPGSAPAPGLCRVRPRARIFEKATGLRPDSPNRPARARDGTPGAGVLPGTLQRSRFQTV